MAREKIHPAYHRVIAPMIPSAMDCATRRNTTAKTPPTKAITKIITSSSQYVRDFLFQYRLHQLLNLRARPLLQCGERGHLSPAPRPPPLDPAELEAP